jgi:hypothetical protein
MWCVQDVRLEFRHGTTSTHEVDHTSLMSNPDVQTLVLEKLGDQMQATDLATGRAGHFP